MGLGPPNPGQPHRTAEYDRSEYTLSIRAINRPGPKAVQEKRMARFVALIVVKLDRSIPSGDQETLAVGTENHAGLVPGRRPPKIDFYGIAKGVSVIGLPKLGRPFLVHRQDPVGVGIKNRQEEGLVMLHRGSQGT